MNHLLMRLAAHPVRHTIEIVRVEIGYHGEVDVVGFKLVFNLLIHRLEHSLSNHGCSLLPSIIVYYPTKIITIIITDNSTSRNVSLWDTLPRFYIDKQLLNYVVMWMSAPQKIFSTHFL